MSLFTLALVLLISSVTSQYCQSNADCSAIANTSCCFNASSVTAGPTTTFACQTTLGANTANLTCMAPSDSITGTICKGQVICSVANIVTCTNQATYQSKFQALVNEPAVNLSASMA